MKVRATEKGYYGDPPRIIEKDVIFDYKGPVTRKVGKKTEPYLPLWLEEVPEDTPVTPAPEDNEEPQEEEEEPEVPAETQDPQE